MTAVLLIAVALGINNLAASIGIGVSGVRGALLLRVALIFGIFEAGMPALGMLAGHAVANSLGGVARWAGGCLLVAVGCYQIAGWYREWRTSHGDHAPASFPAGATGSWGIWRLLASGLALSIDNMVVGFALGAYHVPLAISVVVIALVSVAMSLAGLELGARAGAGLGDRGGVAGGIVLAVVGILMAAGVFLSVPGPGSTDPGEAAGCRSRRGRTRRP